MEAAIECAELMADALLLEAQICKFDIQFTIKKHILGLQVPVDDAPLVAIFDCRYQLLENASGLLLRQSAVVFPIIRQVPSAHVLHNKKQCCCHVKHLQQLHNIWMVQHFHSVNF